MANQYYYDYESKESLLPKLKTDRCWWKFWLLNIVTFGFYEIYFFLNLTSDLEKVYQNRTRPKLMNFVFVFILSAFTFSVVLVIWQYQLASQVEDALKKRDIEYNFGTSDFWKWFFFGSFILIGGFVYTYKLCKAMNLLCENYNERPIID